MAATSPPKRICTSLNTFKDHREPHMAYVDKTALVARIVSRSAEKGYFVNRPRKFGKTVLLDTIATYFKGDREAFRGLAIYDMQMPWEEFPIIRFSMNALRVRSADQFEANLCSSVGSKKRVVYKKNIVTYFCLGSTKSKKPRRLLDKPQQQRFHTSFREPH